MTDGSPEMQQMELPRPARERGKIAPVKFAHAVMRTSRYDEMISWYKTVLEAETTFANRQITFLTYDEEHHRIAISKMPGLLPRPGFMACVEHVAFTYADLGDLLATYRRLKDLGIRPIWAINHGGTMSMYYSDPDGNHVELQIDCFEDTASLNEFLYGDAFRRNPIGIDFDPDDVCARFDRGEPLADLIRWGAVERRDPRSIPVAYMGRLHAGLLRLSARLRGRS